MENIIYNELICRGCSVDVGVVEVYEKDSQGIRRKLKYEIDFVIIIREQKSTMFSRL